MKPRNRTRKSARTCDLTDGNWTTHESVHVADGHTQSWLHESHCCVPAFALSSGLKSDSMRNPLKFVLSAAEPDFVKPAGEIALFSRMAQPLHLFISERGKPATIQRHWEYWRNEGVSPASKHHCQLL